MRHSMLVFLFLLVNSLLLTNCREESPMLNAFNEDAGPDTLRGSPYFPDDPDAAPLTKPSPGNPDYVTDVLLSPGCEPDGTVAVTKGHGKASPCEEIVVTATHATVNHLKSVAANITWSTAYPSIVDVPQTSCLHDGFCWPLGLQDTFDTDGLTDPVAVVSACVSNACPLPRPDNCQDSLCLLVQVKVVPNLEGAWSLSATTTSNEDAMCLMQDGRYFSDTTSGVKRGTISGPDVSFEIDDYLYSGTLAPDRSHMQGTIWETIGQSQIGTWEAARMP